MTHVVIFKGEFSEIPVLTTIAYNLNELNQKTSIICGSIDENLRLALKAENITVFSMSGQSNKGKKNSLQKLIYWLNFRSFCKNKIKKLGLCDIYWIGGADTAICTINTTPKDRSILQINELYDNNFTYRLFLKLISKKYKTIVCPESHRAAIFAAWFKLKNPPIVVPNRPPLKIANRPNDHLLEKIDAIKKFANGRKVAIYQGHIAADRNFINFARALNDLKDKWVLISIGQCHDSTVEEIYRISENYIHIGHVPAPLHLNITAIANLGILMYSNDSLNNLYCAPNKVWEYSAFGIPFICNQLPAMLDIFSRFKCGSCVNDNVASIIDSITEIENNYSTYSTNSHNFFSSFDFKATISNVIDLTLKNQHD